MFVRGATHRGTQGSVAVRKAELSDCEQLSSMQAACYRQDLHEETAVFESIVRCGTSYVACVGSGIVGYLLAHPWDGLERPPPLNMPLDCSSGKSTFVHDLAILPGWRGAGLPSRLLACLDSSRPMSLVAVQGSRGFWEKRGFAAGSSEGLESYGPGAVHMVRRSMH